MAKGDRYVVLTMDKQTGNAGGLSAHIDREVYDAKTDRMVPFRPKSVRDDSRTALNRECIENAKTIGRTQAIWNRLREEGFSRSTSEKDKTEGKKKTRKVKDDAVIALCFVCSSDEDTMKQLEEEGKLDEWIDSTIDWFRKEFGCENVVSAVLHMDETTPHLHVTVVPITHEAPKPRKEKPKFDENGSPIRKYETDKDGNIILDEKGKAIIKKRSYKKQEVTARLSAKDICNPVAMERWQTDYALAMAPFGLRRGIAGSKQKRVPPAEWNLQQVNGKLMAVEKEVEKQNAVMKANEAKIEGQKAEIEQMAKASMFDKLLNSGLSSAVRKAMEDEKAAHEAELLQATIAHDKQGYKYYWESGDKKGQVLTWEELARCLEEEKREQALLAEGDKEAAVEKAKNEARREHEAAMAEMKDDCEQKLKRASLAFDKNGNPIMKDFGLGNRQQITKVERIEMLEKELSDTKKANEDLLDRLKVLRDLIFAFCSLNFKKVVRIVYDQWRKGFKEFTKDLKDILQEAMSGEKTEKGRQSYVNDTFQFAKMMAKTDPDSKLDFDDLKPLHEDAMRIADGTWDSYHEKAEKREQLFDAAVKAVIEMGNCSSQRHLSQDQANKIEAFLAFDGGDRDELCKEIWAKAGPKIERFWRDITQSALEDLRTGEIYVRSHKASLSR